MNSDNGSSRSPSPSPPPPTSAAATQGSQTGSQNSADDVTHIPLHSLLSARSSGRQQARGGGADQGQDPEHAREDQEQRQQSARHVIDFHSLTGLGHDDTGSADQRAHGTAADHDSDHVELQHPYTSATNSARNSIIERDRNTGSGGNNGDDDNDDDDDDDDGDGDEGASSRGVGRSDGGSARPRRPHSHHSDATEAMSTASSASRAKVPSVLAHDLDGLEFRSTSQHLNRAEAVRAAMKVRAITREYIDAMQPIPADVLYGDDLTDRLRQPGLRFNVLSTGERIDFVLVYKPDKVAAVVALAATNLHFCRVCVCDIKPHRCSQFLCKCVAVHSSQHLDEDELVDGVLNGSQGVCVDGGAVGVKKGGGGGGKA